MMSNSIHERFYKKIIYIVEGKDYIKFFNNITTNKIQFRSDNEMIRTLWLNNKGRIVHDLSIGWINNSDSNALLIDHFSSESLIENILKYKMSLDVKIIKTDLEAKISDSSSKRIGGDTYFMKSSISLVDKYLAIGTNKDLELINNFDPMDFILKGISYNKKIFHNKTPMELNLWCAIDFKKGCYLGQEIVARVKYKGQVKRNFSYVKIDKGVDITNTPIYKGENEIGSIIYTDFIDRNASYCSAFINHNENYNQAGLKIQYGEKEYNCEILENLFKSYSENY